MGHESWSLGLAFCPWAAWGLRGQLPVPHGLGRQARAFPVTCSGGWGEPTLRYGFHPPFLTGPGWGRTPGPWPRLAWSPQAAFCPSSRGCHSEGLGWGVGQKERPYSPRAGVTEAEPGPSWCLTVPRRPQLGSPPSAHTHPATPGSLLLQGPPWSFSFWGKWQETMGSKKLAEERKTCDVPTGADTWGGRMWGEVEAWAWWGPHVEVAEAWLGAGGCAW